MAERGREPEAIDPGVLESFERAFRDLVAGCRRTCACGRTFWDSHNGGYDWGEGEIEALEADAAATALDYAVEMLTFEGRYYVIDCDCWKPRAARIIAFIRGHDEAIAAFLTEEQKRKAAEAKRSPVVGGSDVC